MIRGLQLSKRLHQGFRDVTSTKPSELADWTLSQLRSPIFQASTSSRTFSFTFSAFMIVVPTRKASAPAARNRLTSADVSIALSATIKPPGPSFLERICSVVSRLTLRLERLRLLMPYRSGSRLVSPIVFSAVHTATRTTCRYLFTSLVVT